MSVVGKKGTFATVQAPSVDFGSMAERGIDKRYAREEARKKEAEAKKAAAAKARQEAKVARANEIKGDIKAAKATGRSAVDISNRRFVDQARDSAYTAKKRYIETGDPRYKKEFDDQVYQVENLANSIENMNTLLTSVSENYDNYNPKFMPEFEKLFTGINKGNVNITTKDGNMMVTTYDLDPNGDVIDMKTQSLSDILQEPIKASNYQDRKKEFMNLNKLDDITKVIGRDTTRVKEVTDRLEGRIDVFVDNLVKDPNEFADWYVDNYGLDEYNKNKGKFKEKDFDLFKKDKKEDVKESYPFFKDVSRVQPKTPSAKTPSREVVTVTKTPITLGVTRTYDLAEEGGSHNLSEDAQFLNFKVRDNGKISNVESTSGEKALTINTVYYDKGKLYVKVSEVETEGVTGGISAEAGGIDKVNLSQRDTRKVRNEYLISEDQPDRLDEALSLLDHTKDSITLLFSGETSQPQQQSNKKTAKSR